MLRSLIVVAHLLASTSLKANDVEEKLVKKIAKVGGKVELDNTGSVIRVDYSNLRMGASELRELAVLSKLSGLSLNCTHVSDDDLKELTSLSNLSDLNLSCADITDAGLKELVSCLSRNWKNAPFGLV